MAQQTSEKAAQIYTESTSDNDPIRIKSFIEGAKWQQEQQDDFIISFLEFIEGTYSYSNIFDHWYLHSDTSKTYSKKELLKQFKKNNGTNIGRNNRRTNRT